MLKESIYLLRTINYLEKKLLWAKNYKIPFRSNLKIENTAAGESWRFGTFQVDLQPDGKR